MKKWNLEPIAVEFSWGKMPCIVLGEHGRGRKRTLIPYHAGDSEYVGLGTTRSGGVKIIPASEPEGKWLARIYTGRTYTRGTWGRVYVPQSMMDKVQVIAVGWGAFGDAGRIGGWMDILVIVEDGTWIKVKPSGGEWKTPSYWLYFGEEKVFRVGKEEMDIFCEMNQLPPPEEELVELE